MQQAQARPPIKGFRPARPPACSRPSGLAQRRSPPSQGSATSRAPSDSVSGVTGGAGLRKPPDAGHQRAPMRAKWPFGYRGCPGGRRPARRVWWRRSRTSRSRRHLAGPIPAHSNHPGREKDPGQYHGRPLPHKMKGNQGTCSRLHAPAALPLCAPALLTQTPNPFGPQALAKPGHRAAARRVGCRRRRRRKSPSSVARGGPSYLLGRDQAIYGEGLPQRSARLISPDGIMRPAWARPTCLKFLPRAIQRSSRPRSAWARRGPTSSRSAPRSHFLAPRWRLNLPNRRKTAGARAPGGRHRTLPLSPSRDGRSENPTYNTAGRRTATLTVAKGEFCGSVVDRRCGKSTCERGRPACPSPSSGIVEVFGGAGPGRTARHLSGAPGLHVQARTAPNASRGGPPRHRQRGSPGLESSDGRAARPAARLGPTAKRGCAASSWRALLAIAKSPHQMFGLHGIRNRLGAWRRPCILEPPTFLAEMDEPFFFPALDAADPASSMETSLWRVGRGQEIVLFYHSTDPRGGRSPLPSDLVDPCWSAGPATRPDWRVHSGSNLPRGPRDGPRDPHETPLAFLRSPPSRDLGLP